MTLETPTEILSRMIGMTAASDGGPLYTPTSHVSHQSALKGFSLIAVLKAANDPFHTYDNGRVVGQRRHVRGNIVAVVDPQARKVITAYANVVETDLRKDQTDADAQEYAARRSAR